MLSLDRILCGRWAILSGYIVQILVVADPAADFLVANKKRIRYTRQRGRRQKARALDRCLHSRRPKVDAVGWEKLTGVGVCYF